MPASFVADKSQVDERFPNVRILWYFHSIEHPERSGPTDA